MVNAAETTGKYLNSESARPCQFSHSSPFSISVIKHYLAPPNWRKRREARIPKSQLSEAQNFC